MGIHFDGCSSNGEFFEICELILSKSAMVNLQNLQEDTALHKTFNMVAFMQPIFQILMVLKYLNKGKTPWQM